VTRSCVTRELDINQTHAAASRDEKYCHQLLLDEELGRRRVGFMNDNARAMRRTALGYCESR